MIWAVCRAWRVQLALIALAPVINISYPEWLAYYVVAVLCLGLAARPVIERFNLSERWGRLTFLWDEKRNRRFVEQRNREIDRAVRDQRYRSQRQLDPRLPKRW